MSHEIEQDATTGEAAFFSAREDPWHKLGTVTDGCLTAEDAMRVAHLDYQVRKEHIYIAAPNSLVAVPDKFATVRENPFTGATETLGIVGKRYEIVQNLETAEFLNALVGESGAHFETAGSLYNGRKMFVSMKAPKGLLIGGHDAVDLYLIGSNSMDGTSPFRIDASPTRPVCKNTLDMAARNAKATWTVRHSGNVGDKVAEAQKALGVMWDYAAEIEALGNELHDQKMTDAEFRKIVAGVVFPEEDGESKLQRERREQRSAEVFNLWKHAETNADITGTKWGAYNAITEWADWFKPIRGGSEVARAERIADDPQLRQMKNRALAALRG